MRLFWAPNTMPTELRFFHIAGGNRNLPDPENRPLSSNFSAVSFPGLGQVPCCIPENICTGQGSAKLSREAFCSSAVSLSVYLSVLWAPARGLPGLSACFFNSGSLLALPQCPAWATIRKLKPVSWATGNKLHLFPFSALLSFVTKRPLFWKPLFHIFCICFFPWSVCVCVCVWGWGKLFQGGG